MNAGRSKRHPGDRDGVPPDPLRRFSGRATTIRGMTLLSRESAQRSVAMPTPARGGLRTVEAVAFLGVNVALIVLMWVRHGGLDRLGSVADVATGGTDGTSERHGRRAEPDLGRRVRHDRVRPGPRRPCLGRRPRRLRRPRDHIGRPRHLDADRRGSPRPLSAPGLRAPADILGRPPIQAGAPFAC